MILGSLALSVAACGLPANAPMARTTAATLHARGAAQPGSFVAEGYQGRTYKVYLPKSYRDGAPVPLVVMLHGCTQDPDTFATGTRMNQLADSQGFAVMYPAQPQTAHPNKCWNWFKPEDQARDSGEPALIAGMVQQVEHEYAIDPHAVYAAGLSAGAAMTVILGATYPDMFAGLGVCSGLEYQAATNEGNAWAVMNTGGPDPRTAGAHAYQTMGSNAHVMPVMVFHGTADTVVAPKNADQIVAQWAVTNDQISGQTTLESEQPETTSGQVSGGRRYTAKTYRDQAGTAVIEEVLVDQMPHAWSGGQSQGSSFMDPQGPDASTMLWNFFSSHRRH